MKLRNVVLFAAIATLPSAWGSGGDRIPGSRYVSARSAALGDSYIAVAETTADGLFHNPAALAKHQGFSAEPLNLQMQGNSHLNSMLGTDFYKVQDLEGYRETLLAHPNTRPGSSYALLPNFAIQGLGVGVLYQKRAMAQTDGTNIRYRSTSQLIPAVGYGLRLASGVLRLGLSLQWVNQSQADRTVPVATTPLGYTEGAQEGRGFSSNLGMSLTLPYQMQPSLHLVARNLGSVRYSGKPLIALSKNPNGAIPDEPMTVDAALGIVTKIGSGWNLSTSVTWRDATNESQQSQLSHLSTGVELGIRDRFFLRGGFGSGYPAAGLGLRTPRAEAAFAWYSENITDTDVSSRDIRYLFQLAFRAF